MPLRSVNEIPKIPKSHKKDSEKLKKYTPAAKEDSIEYTVQLYYFFNTVEKKQFLRVHIETVKLFSGLPYKLKLSVTRKKSNIDISILGLNAAQTFTSGPLPAFEDLDFEDVYGVHQINLIKQDGSINSVEIDVNPFNKKLIVLKEFLPEKTNNRLFSSYSIVPEKFSFAEEA